ncbi:MAG TPA: lytic transglycosylase domain-containing protein [Azospirillum sp.]|nr:lytic transglycosylase domain-containing protein [Azospirillum sp.]
MSDLPADHSILIDTAEEKYGLPAGSYRSRVSAESAGNPSAVSKKGAIGYAQLMPDTAKELGVDPRDPRANLDGGAHYLNQMMQK